MYVRNRIRKSNLTPKGIPKKGRNQRKGETKEREKPRKGRNQRKPNLNRKKNRRNRHTELEKVESDRWTYDGPTVASWNFGR